MTQDLSRFQHPVGDLFTPVKDASDWESRRLSLERIAFYQANGYLAGIRLLDEEQVERLRSELAQLSEHSHTGNELVLRVSLKRIDRPTKDSLSCARCLACRGGLP